MEKLYVSPKGQLTEIQYHQAVKTMAYVFSVLFHPLLVILYMAAYLIFLHPTALLGLPIQMKLFKFFSVVVNAFLFPLLSVLLMRGLGFIKTIFLNTSKERIIPYVATNIFLFWNFYVFYNDRNAPEIIKALFLGIFLASCAALFINNYFKISMHTIGAGGLVAFMLLLIYNGTTQTALPATIALFIAGVICSSRIMVSNHTQKEIYWGLFTGFACQLISNWIF